MWHTNTGDRTLEKTEFQAKLDDFVRITKDDYLQILRQNGFITDFNQQHLF
jgi:hypothetical protein